MNSSKRATVLRNKIEHAFADSLYPGDTNLVLSDPNDPESREILNDLKGTHWKSLLDNKDKHFWHHCSLAFLTPAGFRFYLPAYLIASLDWNESDLIGHYLLSALCPPPLGVASRDDLLKIVEGMSARQIEATKDFLEYLKDEYADEFTDNLPSQALQLFWNNPYKMF